MFTNNDQAYLNLQNNFKAAIAEWHCGQRRTLKACLILPLAYQYQIELPIVFSSNLDYCLELGLRPRLTE